MEDKIKDWKDLTNQITENFIREYFEIEKHEEVYFDWVSDEPGGVFNFSDYWFDFNTVLKCYELSISRENLFLWYDWNLTNKKVNISLAKYFKDNSNNNNN